MSSSLRDDVSDSGDSAIAEVEAALRANPELRAKTPPRQQGEWEDFERLLAENPELAKPVQTGRSGTAFYYSKNKWDCGHEGEPTKTDIEREPNAGEKDGIDLTTGRIHPDALLTNEIRGICDSCMMKWTGTPNPDNGPAQASSSRNPVEDIPDHDRPPSPQDDIGDNNSDRGGLARNMGVLEIDDSPEKGKKPNDGRPRTPPDLLADYSDDEASRTSTALPYGLPPPINPPHSSSFDEDFAPHPPARGPSPSRGGPPSWDDRGHGPMDPPNMSPGYMPFMEGMPPTDGTHGHDGQYRGYDDEYSDDDEFRDRAPGSGPPPGAGYHEGNNPSQRPPDGGPPPY